MGKMLVAVDDDIDIKDADNILWAIAYRAQPYRDVEVVEAPIFPLDPAAVPPGETRGLMGGKPPRSTAVLIDATMPWPYPPLSLPKKQFMDRAIEIWRDLQLPPLKLKPPYFGYSLGHWTEEEDKEAELATQGRHYETGEKQAKSRKPFGAHRLGETKQPAVDRRQHFRQVLGDQAGTEFGRRLAVQPHGGGGGFKARHALRQQARDHPRQHVAGARGGEPGRRIGRDGDAPIGRGDHRVRPLQKHDCTGNTRTLEPLSPAFA